ncbi:hypothetical protein E2562_017342 [Oryza meyeriana var. granulata]|uniref:Uncharacterized protein n=1 Tax=Oryza meyeriana var. granulata TaxID=110450 RepID=A0A6G1BZ17_9ORYZ|nr:hypothetical protein E2562_017342 [Oryza meyeriana var. granulata]
MCTYGVRSRYIGYGNVHARYQVEIRVKTGSVTVAWRGVRGDVSTMPTSTLPGLEKMWPRTWGVVWRSKCIN